MSWLKICIIGDYADDLELSTVNTLSEEDIRDVDAKVAKVITAEDDKFFVAVINRKPGTLKRVLTWEEI